MKLFLSWSGALSHKVACVLRGWLPSVIQAVEPYVSSEDIDKGTRWTTDIAKELEASSFGLICVTKENLEAPWIHFEAGALSKSIDKAHVVPFLVDVKRSEVRGPLLQFQSTIFEKDDIGKLLRSINGCLPEIEQLKAETVEKALEVWWPELEKDMKTIGSSASEVSGKAEAPKSRTDTILEELLELAREQQRILSAPERLLPIGYLGSILDQVTSVLSLRAMEGTEKFCHRLTRLEQEAMRAHEQRALEVVRRVKEHQQRLATKGESKDIKVE